MNFDGTDTIAHVRGGHPPFYNGTKPAWLVQVDYEDTRGGACNVRFTRQQATALRDALHAFLTRDVDITIKRHKDGKLSSEEKPQ